MPFLINPCENPNFFLAIRTPPLFSRTLILHLIRGGVWGEYLTYYNLPRHLAQTKSRGSKLIDIPEAEVIPDPDSSSESSALGSVPGKRSDFKESKNIFQKSVKFQTKYVILMFFFFQIFYNYFWKKKLPSSSLVLMASVAESVAVSSSVSPIAPPLR